MIPSPPIFNLDIILGGMPQKSYKITFLDNSVFQPDPSPRELLNWFRLDSEEALI